MRILLTGDKGYIGAVMVPLLILEGHIVTGFDSDWFEQSAFSELPAKIVSRKKDLRDLEPSDLEGFDAITHLAGLSNYPLGDLDPSPTYDEEILLCKSTSGSNAVAGSTKGLPWSAQSKIS